MPATKSPPPAAKQPSLFREKDELVALEMDASWPISTDYLRGKVRRERDAPHLLTMYAVQRCVFRWRYEEQWARMQDVGFIHRRPPEELREVATELDKRARRLYQLGRQQEAESKVKLREPSPEAGRHTSDLVTQRARGGTRHVSLKDEL